ncbi:hypothetical protein BLNAU_505 [Blattamonas nauphoetae]|uniref:Uncharacterized protein n=1 Tax=Blattamonas nauphoetae TaxID=2049346 RepID=A0ABQ9YLF3_9EUKA|nr:hypothetical protein BLNAU_505 [Blattamonas nauphoetae]
MTISPQPCRSLHSHILRRYPWLQDLMRVKMCPSTVGQHTTKGKLKQTTGCQLQIRRHLSVSEHHSLRFKQGYHSSLPMIILTQSTHELEVSVCHQQLCRLQPHLFPQLTTQGSPR